MIKPDLLGGYLDPSSGRVTIGGIAQRAGDMVRAVGEHLHRPTDLEKSVGGFAVVLGGVALCLKGCSEVAGGYRGTVPVGLERTTDYARQISRIAEDFVPPLVGAASLIKQLRPSGHNQQVKVDTTGQYSI